MNSSSTASIRQFPCSKHWCATPTSKMGSTTSIGWRGFLRWAGWTRKPREVHQRATAIPKRGDFLDPVMRENKDGETARKFGAGEGNRTLVFSLEGCCSTIELHPQRVNHEKSGFVPTSVPISC